MEEKQKVAIFESIYHVLCAEKILVEKGLNYKIIPVPRQLSSDCGVCLKFSADSEEAVIIALQGKVTVEGVYPLP
ncbi:MAG: DUF3343 domain-containing protein [Deltaproteobacteria bacterium]|nr:DUF3343 domain-containing protein [Deltaproteobacteria bacterium]